MVREQPSTPLQKPKRGNENDQIKKVKIGIATPILNQSSKHYTPTNDRVV